MLIRGHPFVGACYVPFQRSPIEQQLLWNRKCAWQGMETERYHEQCKERTEWKVWVGRQQVESSLTASLCQVQDVTPNPTPLHLIAFQQLASNQKKKAFHTHPVHKHRWTLVGRNALFLNMAFYLNFIHLSDLWQIWQCELRFASELAWFNHFFSRDISAKKGDVVRDMEITTRWKTLRGCRVHLHQITLFCALCNLYLNYICTSQYCVSKAFKKLDVPLTPPPYCL